MRRAKTSVHLASILEGLPKRFDVSLAESWDLHKQADQSWELQKQASKLIKRFQQECQKKCFAGLTSYIFLQMYFRTFSDPHRWETQQQPQIKIVIFPHCGHPIQRAGTFISIPMMGGNLWPVLYQHCSYALHQFFLLTHRPQYYCDRRRICFKYNIFISTY